MGSYARMFVLTLSALQGSTGCASQRVTGRAGRTGADVAAAEASDARAAVTGFIVNGVTSRPLVGAIIELDDRPRAESGRDGRFRIDDVNVGAHLLTARAPKFRTRVQPVAIVVPDTDQDVGPRNDFIVLLFSPSPYFDEFPRLGVTPTCRADTDCPSAQICLMNNFKEMDAPTCTIPKVCATEADCKLGQQCDPVRLRSGDEKRVCQGQPAPEVHP